MGVRYCSCHKSQEEVNKVAFTKCCKGPAGGGTVAPEPRPVRFPRPGFPSPKRARIPWKMCTPPSKPQHPRQRRDLLPSHLSLGAIMYEAGSSWVDLCAGRGASPGPSRWLERGSRSPCPMFATFCFGTVHTGDSSKWLGSPALCHQRAYPGTAAEEEFLS